MSKIPEVLTTGLPGLDKVLKGLLAGDNVVWRMDSVADYHAFVMPYCEAARDNSRKLIYFRFAGHESLLSPDFGAEVHQLYPEKGFEAFIAEVHRVIEEAGRGAFYLFDCLSDLIVDWYSDQMLANFFMLTCPYLYDLETVTYFGLLRNHHSAHATIPILQTAQLFLDIYRHEGDLYVRPLRVQYRYSSTMGFLHKWDGNEFTPITASCVISEIQTQAWPGLDSSISLGSWDRAFIRGRELQRAINSGGNSIESETETFDRLVRMIISRDPGMLRLLSRYLTLQDILEVQERMIGTGLIGGKTVGMLLARAILTHNSERMASIMERHDSFYIGSDVFYTYLVRNGIWWMRQKQRNPDTFLTDAGLSRQRILAGQFPDDIMKQFEEMLDYYGQSPIIVRSSSLLEDNFGNSFAGKYASVFCANQGPKERRLEDLLAAVRTIYASAMSEEALRYRERRGLLESDEQMALLVMRVSGVQYGSNFYPQVAGVGFSFNPYVWSEYIDPKAGVVRLVFGLGTRAVDRSDDDYTRVVALNAPQRRPESNFDEVCQYSQQRMDYIDLTANQVTSGYFNDIIKDSSNLPIEMFADTQPVGNGSPVLTFGHLLSNTDFVNDMREILTTLEKSYEFPVDIEFTANFFVEGKYKVNLVQCRPLPASGVEVTNLPRTHVDPESRILEAHGAVIGHSRLAKVQRMIYVVPSEYGQLSQSDRYQVARLIGKINRAPMHNEDGIIVLLGPGRWGTTTPSLGVPVSFNDINRISALCEIVVMHEHLTPDASLGTHFLNELVEMDILYLALYPDQKQNYFDQNFFENAPNRLCELVPNSEKWQDVVRVIDTDDVTTNGKSIMLTANALEQEVICYSSS
jgi:hypothetical protein